MTRVALVLPTFDLCRFFQLNRLLMWHLPELHEHFEACGVQTNLFATSWFMTLLSDGGMLPDEEVGRGVPTLSTGADLDSSVS